MVNNPLYQEYSYNKNVISADQNNADPRFYEWLRKVFEEIKETFDNEISDEQKWYFAEEIVKLQAILNNSELSVKLRPIQKRAIRKIIVLLKKWLHQWYIKLPTWVWKTILFATIIEALWQPTLIMVPTKDLVTQTADVFLTDFSYDPKDIKLINPEKGTSSGSITEEILQDIENREFTWVVITTNDSLKSLYRKEPEKFQRLKELVSIYVTDEAHKSLWDVHREMMSNWLYDDELQKLHLMFTATPQLHDKNISDYYEEIIDISLNDAIKEWVLIMPQFRGIWPAILQQKDAQKIHHITQEYLDAHSLKFQTGNGKFVYESLVDEYIALKWDLPYNYAPWIGICATIKQAEFITNYLISKGIRAIRVTSANAEFDEWYSSDEAKKMLMQDKVDMIVTVSKVAEWRDVPTLRTLIRFTPTLSPARQIQSFGRILRTLERHHIEKMIQEMYAVWRNVELSDRELLEKILKTTNKTFLIEPNTWQIKALRWEWNKREKGEWNWGGWGEGWKIKPEEKTYIHPNTIQSLFNEGELTKENILEYFDDFELDVWLTKEDVISYIREKYPTVEDFDNMRIKEPGWKDFNMEGVWWVMAIWTKLWVTWIDMRVKEWKNAVRKIVDPEAEEIKEITKEDVISYILTKYPTVEKFDEIKISESDTGWKKINIKWFWWIEAIWTKLWIDWMSMTTKEWKNAVRKIVYPEAEEIKELTKEDIISYIKEKYPTVEIFDKLKINGDHWWSAFTIQWIWAVSAIWTKLWITWISMNRKEWKDTVRKIVYPEAEEIKEMSKEEVVKYIKEKYPTVEKFDSMKTTRENSWSEFSIYWLGGVSLIWQKLWINWISMSTREWKNAVRKIIYSEAEEIKEMSKEDVILDILEKYPTVLQYDNETVNKWNKMTIKWLGWVTNIWKKLWINWISMSTREWKNAVRKIIYPEAEEIKEMSKQDVILYLRGKYPTVEDFDAIKMMNAKDSWRELIIPWLWWFKAIWTKLWITWVSIWVKEWKDAVRKIVYPEAEEIKEMSKEEVIKHIKEKYPTVEEFDSIKISLNGWHRFSIEWVWWVRLIWTKLWVTWIEMQSKEWKEAVRNIIYPEAKILELTKEEIILYIKNHCQTVEDFDNIKMNQDGWRKFVIPWVGWVTNIWKKLWITWVNMEALQWKLAVRQIVYPEL